MPGSCDVLDRSLLKLRDFAADIALVKELKGEVGATTGGGGWLLHWCSP